MEKECETLSETKVTKENLVIHTFNEGRKFLEDGKISRASNFYGDESEKTLARHKSMWACHGGGGDLRKFITTNSDDGDDNMKIMKKMTALQLLKLQMKEYEESPSFSSLAYQRAFVPFYHAKGSPSLEDTKRKTLDSRPERIIIVRTCPSKTVIDEMTNNTCRSERSGGRPGVHSYSERDEYFNTITSLGKEYQRPNTGEIESIDSQEGEKHQQKQRSGSPFKSEEEKNIETFVRSGGLNPEIPIAFAYAIPYCPVKKWENNIPPPEQAEHFCSYLKYVISCHAKASIIVCMNKWCAKLVVAKCNADQLIHVEEIPEYGEMMKNINIYPLGIKNKNVRAMNRRLLRMPHSIMWESQATTNRKDSLHNEGSISDSNEMFHRFKMGVQQIHEELRIGKRKNANPFEIMMPGSSNNNNNNNKKKKAKLRGSDDGGGESGTCGDITDNDEQPKASNGSIKINKITPSSSPPSLAKKKKKGKGKSSKLKHFFNKLKIDSSRITDDDYEKDQNKKGNSINDIDILSTMMVFDPSIEPKNYGQKNWVIPESHRIHNASKSSLSSLSKFATSFGVCNCPACGGTSEWCNKPTNLNDFVGKTPEDFADVNSKDLPCDYCCCKHGHRTTEANECVAVGNLGPRITGCLGWRIPHIKANTPSIIKMMNNKIKMKGFQGRIQAISIASVPFFQSLAKEYKETQRTKKIYYGEWDIFLDEENNGSFDICDVSEYPWGRGGPRAPFKAQFKENRAIDIKMIEVKEFPTLQTLCVEKIRRMADPEIVMEASEFIKLHYDVASRVSRDLRDKYFPQCKYDVIGDHTAKYLAQGKCCARCSNPSYFAREHSKSRRLNNTISQWVDTSSMKMNIWVDLDPCGI